MEESASTSKSQSGGVFKKIFLGVVFIVLVAIALLAIYFFLQYQNAQRLLTNPAAATALQNKLLVEKVGKLVDLPKDETPQVLDVTDKYKLLNQPFFAKTQNGDKVLLYQNNRTAVLYRPSTNKIVNFQSNINIQANSSPTPAPSATEAPVPTDTPQPIKRTRNTQVSPAPTNIQATPSQ